MRVEGLLSTSAGRFPQKTALVSGSVRMSYTTLEGDANRLAHALRHHGISDGDRVVVFLENCVEAVVSLFATAKAGGVFSLVNPGTKSDKLAYILDKYGASAIVTHERLLGTTREALAQSACRPIMVVAGSDKPREGIAYDAMLDPAPGDGPPESGGIDVDLAMIVTTSGSTGAPKGVMMTHQNVDFASASIMSYLESVPEDVVLSVLPLAFDYGLYQVLMSIRAGATLVLEKSFAYPASVLAKLRDEGVTGFPIVPTMGAILLQMKSAIPNSLPRLRYLTSTAASLPPAHIRALRDLFPGARLYSMYGLTECKRCTYLPPEELDRRPDSVGIAIPGTQAYVVDEEGRRAPPGQIGELVIRGGHVFKGYWNDQGETERMLKPGPYPWEKMLHTGDLFRSDEDGYLYFVGRKDDIIKSAGEKVSPKEVENVLYALKGVREAAVVGVPHPVLGMAIHAIVAAEPSLGERDIIGHCAARLEPFMVPSSVEFRASLPTTSTGKIRRSALQAEVLAHDAAGARRAQRTPQAIA